MKYSLDSKGMGLLLVRMLDRANTFGVELHHSQVSHRHIFHMFLGELAGWRP